MRRRQAFPQPVATGFFLLGLFSALSFRAIIIAQHANPSYVRVLWYLAVISNLIFFLFRYHISLKRKNATSGRTIIQKLDRGQPLDDSDRSALVYLLTSIQRSRENLNYMSLFILSTLAIIIDIYLTLK